MPISDAIQDYLFTVEMTRARKTYITYQTGMNQFSEFLRLSDYNPDQDDIATLSEQTAGIFAQSLLDQRFASSTVKLYLTAVSGFFEYLALELNANLNLDLVRRILKSKSPRLRRRLPQFSWEDIEQVIAYCQDNQTIMAADEKARLIELRDRALVLTLADTGLRIHEACGLARGDLDWNRNVALITGKGSKQALVRFSRRAIAAIRRYLSARAALDGASGQPLSSMPVFARHDRAAGKRMLSVSTVTGEKIVSRLAGEALQDEEKARKITPHSFRHYFVTRVVKATNNIKVAQELARHENIATTEIYTHLIDQDLDEYYNQAIEDEEARKSHQKHHPKIPSRLHPKGFPCAEKGVEIPIENQKYFLKKRLTYAIVFLIKRLTNLFSLLCPQKQKLHWMILPTGLGYPWLLFLKPFQARDGYQRPPVNVF